MKARLRWYLLLPASIGIAVACADTTGVTDVEQLAHEQKMAVLLEGPAPQSVDEAYQRLHEAFPTEAQMHEGPSFTITASSEPRLSEGGLQTGPFFLTAVDYVMLSSPHYGWVDSGRYMWHININVYRAKVAFLPRALGGKYTERANLHVGLYKKNGKGCVFLHDTKSGWKRDFCLNGKTLKGRVDEIATRVQEFFKVILGITVAYWVAQAIAYVISGLLVVAAV